VLYWAKGWRINSILAALLVGFALLVLLAGYAMTFMRDEVRAAASLLML